MSDLKRKRLKQNAAQPYELEVDIQYSSTLSTHARELLKPILSKSNVRRWATWAIDPETAHLQEITLRIVDKKKGLSLNNQFRGRAYATNILTFNDSDLSNTQSDLLMCAPVVIEEAKLMGVALKAHCAHLLIHAVLHAQGYDHEAGPQQELVMESLESFLMMSLGFGNPYLEC